MEDWAVRAGWAECLTLGGNRNLHLITRWAHLQGNTRHQCEAEAVEEPRNERVPDFASVYRRTQ